MTTLFTINKSWHNSTWLFEQLMFASEGDSILLLEDAVLCIDSQVTLASFVAKCRSRKIDVFALREDTRLRGVENRFNDIELVDYAGFVALVTQHDKQVAW